MEDVINKPYKICDVNRNKKKGVVATSLEDLLTKVPDKLGLPPENLTVVMESDGTEVDDKEYFSTLDPDTSLMILHGVEKWGPNIPKFQMSLDQTDDIALGDKSQLVNLLGRLQHNLCHIYLLENQDLERLSNMEPESFLDIVTDRNNRIILEHIKRASGRILIEKREAQEAMELLKLYDQNVANSSEDVSSPAYEASKSASPRAQTTMEMVHPEVQRALEHTENPVNATSRSPLRHQQHQQQKSRNPLIYHTDSAQQDSYIACLSQSYRGRSQHQSSAATLLHSYG